MALIEISIPSRWLKEVLRNQQIILGKLDYMSRSVDDALAGLVEVAVSAVNGLKAAKKEIEDLKASDAADDAAQLQAALDSVAAKIDAATAALTENPEVPVEAETPVEEEPLPEVDPEA